MRFRLHLILTQLLLVALASTGACQEVRWEKILPDLDFSQVNVKVNPFLSSEVILFRTRLSKLRLGVIKASDSGSQRAMIKPLAKTAHAVLALNGSFFDEGGKALGLIISRGILGQPLHRGGKTLTGVFAVLSSGVRIMQRQEFSATGVIEALQAGPRLIENGTRVKGINETSAFSMRSGICIDATGAVILYCTSSGVLGMTLSQVQDLLLTRSVDCIDALNLDGGGSTQLYFDARLAGAPADLDDIHVHGSDPIPVALGIFLD
jgi:exopolysaccharide biosynthesis protein